MSVIQEDIDNRSVALYIKAGKITSSVLAKAMLAIVGKINKSRNAPKIGEQSLKQLLRGAKGGTLSSVEITDNNIKDFDPIARKYSIGYALQKDDSTQPPTWVVLFKCKDVDAMTAAFKEFSKKVLAQEAEQKPSVKEAVREHNRNKVAVKVQAKSKDAVDKNAIRVKVKGKDKGVPEL